MVIPILGNPGEPGYWDIIFDVIPFPIYVADVATHDVICLNRAMRQRIGEVGSQKCYQAIYGQESPCFFCKIDALEANGTQHDKCLVFEHFNDVDDRWYQLQEALITWFDGRRAKYSIAVDISALKAVQNALAEAHAELALKNKALARASITDTLTGLNNRGKLDEVLAAEMARSARSGTPLSIILADIDLFKSINDTYGHPAGDEVLIRIADILRVTLRSIDIVGRWGGEEFMIICPNTDLNGAETLAEKLRHAIADHDFPTIGQKTASFGVVQYLPGEKPQEIIGRADKALYRAKARGRNRVEVAEG